MSFTSYEKNGVLVVKIDEERLDASTAPDFKKYVLDFVSEGKRKILLNMI